MTVISKPKRSWWRGVRTEPVTIQADEPVVIQRRSLDELENQIRSARGRVVECQCHLARAEMALEDAKDAFVSALAEAERELGPFSIKRIE